MADPGFEAFLWSLTQQESGGNYGAVGVLVDGDRAYGRYQVMGANIPSWTKKYYGRSLTAQQYLNSREAQDAVVRGVLGGYYKKYGARGAAAMWYSGQSNPNKTYGNPPVYKYVQSVIQRAGSYAGPTNSPTSNVGSTYSVAAVTPKLDKRELATKYGLTWDMINSDKSLRDLFNEAVKNDYDDVLFTAKLKNTPWWRKTPDDLRKYLLLKTGDPTTWKQKVQEANFAVNQLAVSVGFSTQLNSKNQATKTLQQAVYSKMALGWSDARLKSFFAARVGINQGANSVVGGEVGDVFNKLHELAYMNGMKYTNWYGREARNIVSGKSTIQAAEGNIRREAAAKYGAFADQIRAGQNVLDLAQPYIASVAQILELPATDIDLFNNHVSRAMTAKPNKDGSQYPLWRFETELRSDPLWRKTNNAREGMMSVARQVARDFGMAW